MGDMSEARTLIIIGTFVTMLIGTIALLPNDIYVYSEQNRAIQFESGFNPRGVFRWNTTTELAQEDMEYEPYGMVYYEAWGKDVFGHHLWWVITAETEIGMTHYYVWFSEAFTYGSHAMEFVNKEGVSRGTGLTITELETDFNSNDNASIYEVRCEHFYFEAAFVYNLTAYTGFEDAIDNDGLYLVAGIDWDQMGTTMDAWGIISGILLFDLPGAFTDNLWTYILVSVPLWLGALYLTFIFVLRVVGAVFGGGGA